MKSWINFLDPTEISSDEELALRLNFLRSNRINVRIPSTRAALLNLIYQIANIGYLDSLRKVCQIVEPFKEDEIRDILLKIVEAFTDGFSRQQEGECLMFIAGKVTLETREKARKLAVELQKHEVLKYLQASERTSLN